MSPGHTWQLNDYGFGYAWVVLPIAAVAILLVTTLALTDDRADFQLGGASTPDEATSSAMVLAVTGGLSLYLSPALHIPRYHVAAVECSARRHLLALESAHGFAPRDRAVGRWSRSSARSAHSSGGAEEGSVRLRVCSRAPLALAEDAVAPYPPPPPPPPRSAQVQDIGTHEIPRTMISPAVNPDTGLARERGVKAGDIVGDHIDFAFLALEQRGTRTSVVGLSSNDPLGEARSNRRRLGLHAQERRSRTSSRDRVRAGSSSGRSGAEGFRQCLASEEVRHAYRVRQPRAQRGATSETDRRGHDPSDGPPSSSSTTAARIDGDHRRRARRANTSRQDVTSSTRKNRGSAARSNTACAGSSSTTTWTRWAYSRPTISSRRSSSHASAPLLESCPRSTSRRAHASCTSVHRSDASLPLLGKPRRVLGHADGARLLGHE